MERLKELEYITISMVMNTAANGRMIKKMDMGHKNILVVIFMLEVLITMLNMDLASIPIVMGEL